MRREFASFDVAAVVRELKAVILGSRVNNVYQLNDKTLVLKLHKADEPPLRLVLEAGKRMHLTSYALEKPLTPPAFCMALRKYLRGGWLTNIEQYEFERIVIFYFNTKTGEIRLFLELFGEGNIILVDGEYRILQALSYKRMRDRSILRGEIFRFPPPSGRNPLKICRKEMEEELRKYGDAEVIRVLARLLSVGGVYAEEILLRAGVDKKTPSKALEGSQIGVIFDHLQGLLSQVVGGELEPCVVLNEANEFVDVVPVRLKRYEGFVHQPYSSFNEALDDFYTKVTVLEKTATSVEADRLKLEAEKLKRIIGKQEKTLREYKEKIERDKRIGDAIYLHSTQLQTLIDKFLLNKKSGEEWDKIVSKVLAEKRSGLSPSVFFEAFNKRELVIDVCVDGIRFGLDLHKDLFANAARFYERAKRTKQKLEGAQTALERTRKKLEEVNAKIKVVETLERFKPVEMMEELARHKTKRKEWFEKFRWFTSSEGFLVVAGKDAVSNEVLIKKYAESDDLVFHADIVGAPFVVIKTGGKKPGEQCLREAGEFAAAFSRGWREGFASVDVYWVKPTQLCKSGPSGEYVPHGAFMVRGQRNWMRGVPLRLAVGVSVEEGDNVRFLGGPVEAVKTMAKAYVIIVPGDQSDKELSKRVLKALSSKMPKELREKISKTSIEEIREFIPYNKGRILENQN